MNRTSLLAIAVFSSLSSSIAHASGFSLGATVGAATVDAGTVNGGFVEPTVVEEDTTSFRLFGSYDVNRFLALDSSILVLGPTNTTLERGNGAPIGMGGISRDFSLEIRTLTVGVTACWPVTDRLSIRAGCGAAITFSTAELSGDRYGNFTEKSNGVLGFDGHAGVNFALNEKVALGLQASYLDFGTKMGTSDTVTGSIIEIGAAYRF